MLQRTDLRICIRLTFVVALSTVTSARHGFSKDIRLKKNCFGIFNLIIFGNTDSNLIRKPFVGKEGLGRIFCYSFQVFKMRFRCRDTQRNWNFENKILISEIEKYESGSWENLWDLCTKLSSKTIVQKILFRINGSERYTLQWSIKYRKSLWIYWNGQWNSRKT